MLIVLCQLITVRLQVKRLQLSRVRKDLSEVQLLLGFVMLEVLILAQASILRNLQG